MRFQLTQPIAFVFCLLLLGCNRIVAIPVQTQEPAAPNSSTAGRKSSQAPTTQHSNRLAQETSPYLLQHARNPVNWYPWGPEAFERAVKENKPIFLSVGYSTCYWCHVMERESFENEDVAAILNEHFICIKVDREERPEVDQQFMTATQLITGRGGWPNSVWLTPDGKPWMAGTYFPREKFKSSLLKLDEFWNTRRADVLKQAENLAAAVEQHGSTNYNAKPITPELFSTTIETLQINFDRQLGGFGSAPKFPPHANLAVLADQYRRHKSPDVLEMIDRTLIGMARGGVYDQIGGGFHRYSTDAKWLVPHFEKMLYDNAQLVRSYTDGFLLTGDQEHRDAIEGIFVWLQREMTSPEGAFYSAIDSESDAQEGKFYVWRWSEIVEVLGGEDGNLFAEVYGAEESGNFIDEVAGRKSEFNIFHRSKSLTEIAATKNIEPARFADRIAAMRAKLLERRQLRVYPHLDDKILAAWNGLMIDALAYAGRHLNEPRYTAAAARAANFIESSMVRDGRLLRTWRAGQAKLDGYLDDYAYVAAGFLELHRATGKERYLESAKRFADRLLIEFQDDSAGGFFFTTENPENAQQDVLFRSKNLSGGGNQPTGNGVAAQLLFELGSLTGDKRYTDSANRTMDGLSGYIWQVSISGDHLLIAAATKLDEAASAEANASAKLTEADATFAATAVKGELFASQLQVSPGDSFQIAVRMTIEPGWHLYGEGSDANVARPVSLSFDSSNLAHVVETRAPPGTRKLDAVLGKEIELLEGTITYFVQLQVPNTALPGKHQLKLAVLTQACDAKQCAAPEQNEIVVDYEVSSKPFTSESRHLDIFDGK